MSKDQIISDAKVILLQDQDSAIVKFGGAVYDGGFGEGVASVPPADADEQEKIDAAVAAAVAPLNQEISDLSAKDAADLLALADAQAALVDLQGKFDSLSSKEGIEAGIISGLQSSLGVLQDIVAKLAGLQPVP